MAQDNGPKSVVKADPFKPNPNSARGVGFQSDEAKIQHLSSQQQQIQSEEDVRDAAVNSRSEGGEDEYPRMVALEEREKRVIITPRQTVPRTIIGGTEYSFTAGKRATVPRHVADLLQEKGLLLVQARITVP